jgi:hypothetical protein
MSPALLFLSPSIATIPSIRLHNNRPWIPAIAATNSAVCVNGAETNRSARKALPANAAKPILAHEIALGITPRRASHAAEAAAHRELRALIGRRAKAGAASIALPLMDNRLAMAHQALQ